MIENCYVYMWEIAVVQFTSCSKHYDLSGRTKVKRVDEKKNFDLLGFIQVNVKSLPQTIHTSEICTNMTEHFSTGKKISRIKK